MIHPKFDPSENIPTAPLSGSYSLHKLKMRVNDSIDADEELHTNIRAARRYAMAYDDYEIDEILHELIADACFFGTLKGVARGPGAIRIALEDEWKKYRLSFRSLTKRATNAAWTVRHKLASKRLVKTSRDFSEDDACGQFTPVTPHVFERNGFCHDLKSWNPASRFAQRKVRELLVVEGGKVVSRSLQLRVFIDADTRRTSIGIV